MALQKKSLKECCEILNIDPSNLRNENEIKRAYHRLAIKWHPDKNIGKEKNLYESKFKDLAEAYDILIDPVKRSQAEYESKKKELFTKGFVTIARTTKFDGSLFGGGAKFAKQGTNPGLIQISQRNRNLDNQNANKERKVNSSSNSDNYFQISEKLFTGINTIYETVSNIINGSEISVNIPSSKITDFKNALLGINILKTNSEKSVGIDNSLEKEDSLISSGSEISDESEDGTPYLSSINQNLPDYRQNKIFSSNVPDYRIPNYINLQTICSGSDGPHMFASTKNTSSEVMNANEFDRKDLLRKICVRHAQKKVMENDAFPNKNLMTN